MNRVIFVGIHNKPNCTALCSSTKTGKIIDKIARAFKSSVKTNLYNVAYFPKYPESEKLIAEWESTHLPDNFDIIVALGRHVSDALKTRYADTGLNIIYLPHPAWVSNLKGNYVLDAQKLIVDTILNLIVSFEQKNQ